MKSRITIAMDWDNRPIIKIDYAPSEDVRDDMVHRFLHDFGGDSCWANFSFTDWASDSSINSKAKLRPIKPEELQEQVEHFSKTALELKDRAQPKSISSSDEDKKLPSRFDFDDDVWYTLPNSASCTATSSEPEYDWLPGRIIGIKFTRSSVLYDVINTSSNKVIEDLSSSFVKPFTGV